MSPCGCTSACGCDVQGDGTTASVVRQGDTFIVSAIPLILEVADSDCIALGIDDDKVLTAEPILDPDDVNDAVELVCGPNGLRADLLLDEASTAIVTQGPGGLRVDVPPADAVTGTEQPGDLIFYGGVGVRPGAIDADGEPVPRAGYADLHDALSLFATDADRVSGSDVITGIPSTRFMAAGMPLEATGFPFGTTVAAVLGSTSIQASANATTSGGDTEVRVYPHGNGDGIATFNTPNMSRRYPKGYDYAVGDLDLGETGGGTTALTAANIPLLTHGVTVNESPHDHGASASDDGHDHGGVTGTDNHNHTTATAGRSFVEVETATLQQVRFQSDPGGDSDLVVDANDANTTYGQKNDASVLGNTHDHPIAEGFASITVDVTPNVTGVDVDVADHGSATPDPIEVDPDHLVGRWMVVV